MPNPMPTTREEISRIVSARRQQAEADRNQEAQIDQLVVAMSKIRSEIEEKGLEWHRLAEELQRVVRKGPQDDATLRYRNFTLMQSRLAGVVAQTLRRAETGGRLLTAAKADRVESQKRAQAQESKRQAASTSKQVAQSLLPQSDDFESLYEDYVGEENPYAV